MIKSTYVKSKQQYKVAFELPQDRVGKDHDVRVLGTFNDWSWENGLKLKAGKSAYSGSTQLPAGNYEFRYLVDGNHWVNDDQVDSYSDSGHGTQNNSFSLEEVAAKAPAKQPAAKKPAAKKAPAKKTVKVQAADSAPASKPVVTPKKKAAPAKKTAAKATTKKTKASGDDLKKIEGIGPKIAGLLNESGINTYSDLAKAQEKQLADVLQKAGARFRLAKHDTWQQQAKLAAAGKTDELKKLQEQLKGGRK